jgi:solute carrier family 25 uncoupling protein 8/9
MIAVTMFQPTDVVKIRMQAQTGMPPAMRKYKNSFQAYRHLYNGGFSEAWRGLKANQFRLAVVNVSELVTYDILKDTFINNKIMEDNTPCHFVSAAGAGLITTLVASPIDVVKTRLMNSAGGTGTMFSVAKNMLFREGITSFYKGVLPSYLRLGSWNIVMFMSFEQYKKVMQPSKREDIVFEPRVPQPMRPQTQTVSCEMTNHSPIVKNC